MRVAVSAACVRCPGEFCVPPIDMLAPLNPAENICPVALKTHEPLSGLSLASSLTEQAIALGGEEGMDNLELSQLIIARAFKDGGVQRIRGQRLMASMPMIAARVQRHYPTTDNISSSLELMQGSLADCRDYIRRNNAAFQRWTEPAPANPERLRTMRRDAIGVAGEIITLYLAAYGASRDETPILIPSSVREDSPISEDYISDAHDCHTYNPENPANRTALQVRTTRDKPRHYGSAKLFDLRKQATEAYFGEANMPAHRSLYLNVHRILGLLVLSEDNSSDVQPHAVAFRDNLTEKLQGIIQAPKAA